MGNYYAKVFVRNDDMEGRGKQVLYNAKAFGLRKEEMNAMFSEYYLNHVESNGTINVNLYLANNHITFTPLSNLIFQLFDIEKNNRLPFNEYMISLWNICTLKELDMINFVWSLFDTNQTPWGYLLVSEIKLMLDFIWGFTDDPGRDEVLALLEMNKDGKITLPEVRVLYTHHKFIFEPVFKIQEQLRKGVMQGSTMHNFFWNRLVKRRYKMFHPGRKKNDGLNYKAVFDLIDDFPPKVLARHVMSNLHYFYKMEGVPRERYNEWVEAVASKKPPVIKLPPEMYEDDLEKIAKARAEQEEKLAEAPQPKRYGMHSSNLFSNVKKGGIIKDSDEILGPQGNGGAKVFESQEDADRRRLEFKRRRHYTRDFVSIADFQAEALSKYYPEKPIPFPVHPYLPDTDEPELFERVVELTKFTDGEEEDIKEVIRQRNEDGTGDDEPIADDDDDF